MGRSIKTLNYATKLTPHGQKYVFVEFEKPLKIQIPHKNARRHKSRGNFKMELLFRPSAHFQTNLTGASRNLIF